MTSKTIDLVAVKDAVKISFAQHLVTTVDAFLPCIILHFHAMPSVHFRESCFAQSTYGACCNVSARIEWLVVA